MDTPDKRLTSTRRGFLRGAALLPFAAAALQTGALPAPAAATPVRRAGGPRLKPALNAYSFLELLNERATDPARGIDLLELCDFCAKHDFDAVDVTAYFLPGYADIALAAPHAVNWQVKETLTSRADGPRTDMRKLVAIIRASGYRGYVPIETLAMGRKDYDPLVLAPGLLAELREAIAATEAVAP